MHSGVGSGQRIKEGNTRNSSQELLIKLTSHIEELAQVTDAARMREAMLAYSDSYRLFILVGTYLWIEIDTSLPSQRVTRILDAIAEWRGYPKQLRLDNGPEFISKHMAAWAEEHKITLAFIQPGKPAQNAYVERFNRTFREDVLDAYLFTTLQEARDITETWVEEYNAIRPHDALQGLPPYQFTGFYP